MLLLGGGHHLVLRRLLDLGEALDQVDQAGRNGVHVGLGVAATREGPLHEPGRAGERADHEHVVGALERQLVGALADLGGLAARDVAGDVRPGKKLNGHVLEQVRELGVAHHVAEGAGLVPEAHVVAQLGHDLPNAGSALKVLTGHNGRVGRQLDGRVEVLRADNDLLDFK